MKTVSLGRITTAAIVIGSIIGTGIFAGPRNRKRRTDVVPEFQRELDENLITPANETFAGIWPVIYSGTTALAVHQALPSQADNPRYERAQPWFIVGYLLNGLFGLFFSRGDKASRVSANAITVLSLPTALGLHQALEIGRTNVAGPEKWLRTSISLWAGWLTVATGVSATNLLLQAGYRVRPQQAVPWATGLLAVLGGVGVAVSRKLNDPYYLLPFVAGFTGIAAKQQHRHPAVAGLAATLAIAHLGAFALALRSKLDQKPEERPALQLAHDTVNATESLVEDPTAPEFHGV